MLASARALVADIKTWKQGKTINDGVHIYSKRASGAPAGWHCRISEHAAADATFDEFWAKLGVDKADNEVLCVGGLR